MAVLTRRPKSGFILYPKDVARRTVDGTARFRTRCDVLVGPCACGAVHQENDGWVQELLGDYNHSLEILTLIPNDRGEVKIPRYWAKLPDCPNCDTLHGSCKCGKVHRANESWVWSLLDAHSACIDKCPAALEPMVHVRSVAPLDTVEETHTDDIWQNRGRRSRPASLDRRDI